MVANVPSRGGRGKTALTLASAVKKLGATLAGAANESQLNDKLGFILEEKILLEKE